MHQKPRHQRRPFCSRLRCHVPEKPLFRYIVHIATKSIARSFFVIASCCNAEIGRRFHPLIAVTKSPKRPSKILRSAGQVQGRRRPLPCQNLGTIPPERDLWEPFPKKGYFGNFFIPARPRALARSISKFTVASNSAATLSHSAWRLNRSCSNSTSYPSRLIAPIFPRWSIWRNRSCCAHV